MRRLLRRPYRWQLRLAQWQPHLRQLLGWPLRVLLQEQSQGRLVVLLGEQSVVQLGARLAVRLAVRRAARRAARPAAVGVEPQPEERAAWSVPSYSVYNVSR